MSGLTNGFTMCDHRETVDCGEYVCIKCGVVLGQEYIYTNKVYEFPRHNKTKIDLHSNICNILDNLNLNISCYANDVYDLIDKYLSDFKCKNELKTGAAIFHILSLNGIPYQLNRISALLCTNINETKKLFKLIKIFPQENTLSNDISKLVEPLLNFTNFEKIDKNEISRLITVLACKYCSYSPITQIAGISYWYFKTLKRKKIPLKYICDCLFISQNSVHLYLNHDCINTWNSK